MDFNFNFNFPFAPETARLKADDTDEPIEHPPIVIDPGSASIKFSVDEYRPVPGQNKFSSDRLFLHQIELINLNDGTKHVCLTVPGGVRCKVVVICQRDHGAADTKEFTIIGANLASGGSPTVDFDFEEFTSVTSEEVKCQKYSNASFKIKSLKIFKVAPNGDEVLIHSKLGGGHQATACPFVPDNGNCRIRILDEHLGP